MLRATSLAYVNRDFVTAATDDGREDSADPGEGDPPEHRSGWPVLRPHRCGVGRHHRGVASPSSDCSIPEPHPSVGNIISEGLPYLQNNSDIWITLFPCLYLFFLLVSISYIGDRLRSRFDVREGNV